MKFYSGKRDKRGLCHVWIVEKGESRELPYRLDLCAHSPTGYEWGYGGSGPAQLALRSWPTRQATISSRCACTNASNSTESPRCGAAETGP